MLWYTMSYLPKHTLRRIICSLKSWAWMLQCPYDQCRFWHVVTGISWLVICVMFINYRLLIGDVRNNINETDACTVVTVLFMTVVPFLDSNRSVSFRVTLFCILRTEPIFPKNVGFNSSVIERLHRTGFVCFLAFFAKEDQCFNCLQVNKSALMKATPQWRNQLC